MTWKCKIGNCVFPELPEDFPLMCKCASEVLGKVTKKDIANAELLHELRQEIAKRDRDIACLNAVRASVENLNAETGDAVAEK